MIKLGSHVNCSGNEMLLGSVKEAISYSANTFMFYLGAPQNTYRKDISLFHKEASQTLMKENNIDIKDVVVHAPYIINLAQSDDEKRMFAVNFISSEIINCSKLGITKFVVHPGASVGQERDVALLKICQSLTEILDNTKDLDVVIALETMAGKGTECLNTFDEVKFVLNYMKSERIKVCLDTCHINDAGYDIKNNYEAVLKEFDDKIGFTNLSVIHVNDSKNMCGARKDRHENIGFGFIGFDTLCKIVHDKRFENVPKILETPYIKTENKEYAPYKFEIEMLKEKKFNDKIKDL